MARQEKRNGVVVCSLVHPRNPFIKIAC